MTHPPKYILSTAALCVGLSVPSAATAQSQLELMPALQGAEVYFGFGPQNSSNNTFDLAGYKLGARIQPFDRVSFSFDFESLSGSATSGSTRADVNIGLMEFAAGAVVLDTEMVRLEPIIGYGRYNVGVTVTQGSSSAFADEAHNGMLYGLRGKLSVPGTDFSAKARYAGVTFLDDISAYSDFVELTGEYLFLDDPAKLGGFVTYRSHLDSSNDATTIMVGVAAKL